MTEHFTTSITEAKIFYGIELLATGKRREELLAAAEAMFTEDLAERVFGFESDAARAFLSAPCARQTHQPRGCAESQRLRKCEGPNSRRAVLQISWIAA